MTRRAPIAQVAVLGFGLACANKPAGDSMAPAAEVSAPAGVSLDDGDPLASLTDALESTRSQLAAQGVTLPEPLGVEDGERADRLAASPTETASPSERDGPRCERICELAEAACDLQAKICDLADEHRGERRYATVCERAAGTCERASSACRECAS